jgi:hypothetical protein
MEDGMEGELETHAATAAPRRNVPAALKAHPFVLLLVVGALVGGGLRFIPTGSASAAGGGAGQTACAAK